MRQKGGCAVDARTTGCEARQLYRMDALIIASVRPKSLDLICRSAGALRSRDHPLRTREEKPMAFMQREGVKTNASDLYRRRAQSRNNEELRTHLGLGREG